MTSRRLALPVICLLVAGWPATGAAQEVRGTIRGHVVDPTGRGVPGAEVRLSDESVGFSTGTRTDDLGWYLLTEVRPGEYRIEVAQAGFRRHTQPVTVAVNANRRLDVTLQPGAITEVVQVTADAGLLDPLTTSLVTRLSPDRITNLPLDGRNFLELALLAPGAAPAAEGSAGSARGDFAFNVNGAREDANAFLLDGVQNFDPKLNTVAVLPPLESIREFEVVTSLPDAAFGRAGGAQVNVITRSGTNDLRGTAHEFLRTAAFNARNYFAPRNEPAPDYVRHQFGVSLGGPIVDDQLFFFADYEGTRLTEGVTRVTNVPTLAERVGNFSSSAFGVPTNPLTGQPFGNGRVPAFMLNPIGLAVAGLYPRPNRDEPFANFVSSPDRVDHADQIDGRVDAAYRDGWLTFRYSLSDRRLFEPFAGPGFPAVPGYGTDVPRRAQNLAVSDVRAFGDGYMNEARLSWTRVAIGVFQETQGTSLNQEVGLPELSANPRDWGLSLVRVAGFSSLGDEFNNPQESRTNHWQLSDTVSRVYGRHALKAGLELRGLSQSAYRDVQARGLLQFTNQAFTGNALADLLIGLPTVTVGAMVDNPQDLGTHSYSLFLQDTMQFSPTLTLSGGLRYEFHAPPVDATDRVTLYDPDTGTIVPVGTDEVPRAGFRADRNNFAPRLGAAWAARPDTVVRAGYGVTYDQAALAPNEFLYFNDPYFSLNTYFSVPDAGYTLTLFDPFPAQFPVPLPKSATAVDRDLRTAYYHQWNMGLEHALSDTTAVSVAYVGSLGRNLIAARDINQPDPSPVVPNLRPNPLFADIMLIESRARSRYQALQLTYDRAFSDGMSYRAAYTIGKSMDDASGFFSSAGDANFPMDSNDPDDEWARSNFDIRHRFALNGLWELPFGPSRRWLNEGLLATCLGNWNVYGVLTLQSGRPFTVAVHPDIDQSNTGRANLGFGSNDRPDRVGDPAVSDPGPDGWFDPAAYALPPFGTFGDEGRNSLDGPGYSNLNLAFTREVAFDRGLVQVRLEVYNVFNASNFDLPDNFLGSPTFGQILSAGSPRRLQLGVRLTY